MYTYSLVSDLHLDHPQPKTPPLEENVIVAGDSGNGLIGLKYLNKLKRKGHKVFAVDGNHEHYSNLATGRTVDQTERQFYDGLEQRRVLDVAPDLAIVGINGWYWVQDEDHWRGYMNDSRLCNLTAAEVNLKAIAQADWLNTTIAQAPGQVIVVTHTSPTTETLDPRYEGSSGNGYYWSPYLWQVLNDRKGKIAVWHHGHTHAAADKIVNGVRVVCNPRGYPRENPTWAPLTLSI